MKQKNNDLKRFFGSRSKYSTVEKRKKNQCCCDVRWRPNENENRNKPKAKIRITNKNFENDFENNDDG